MVVFLTCHFYEVIILVSVFGVICFILIRGFSEVFFVYGIISVERRF